MLEESRQKRSIAYQSQIGKLVYERYQLSQDIEAYQRRIVEIDKSIAREEGALSESEYLRKDLKTQETIDAAKAADGG